MNRSRLSILIGCFLFIFPSIYAFSAEETFFLLDNTTNKIALQLGVHIDEPTTPCSTFKIALSLMGYDAEVLKDEKAPIWDFQEEYVDLIESRKISQTPTSWIKNSCVWYSKVLALKLGMGKIQNYLRQFEYGNQNMSGGITTAWLSSSLKISPREQVEFLRKMIRKELPVSDYAVEMTKILLFAEECEGWKLFGKTGLGSLDESLEIGWFVGWFEKNECIFPFAYQIREQKINRPQRILRVKELFLKKMNIGQ